MSSILEFFGIVGVISFSLVLFYLCHVIISLTKKSTVKKLTSGSVPKFSSTSIISTVSTPILISQNPVDSRLGGFYIKGKKIEKFDDIPTIIKIKFYRFIYRYSLSYQKKVKDKDPNYIFQSFKFDRFGLSLSININGMSQDVRWLKEILDKNTRITEKVFLVIMNFYSGTFDGQKLTINDCSKSYTFDQLKKEYAREVYPLLLLAQDDPESLLSSDYFPPDMFKLILPRFEL